jgi:tetratricopeptide (TPR) repeat protein
VEPDRAQPFYCLGYVFYQEQDWITALRWFEEALRIYPNYLVCLYRKGYALYAYQKPRKSIEPLERAAELYRGSQNEDFRRRNAKTAMKVLFLLARARYRTRDFEEALRLLQQLFREDEKGFINPWDKHYALGKSLAALGREEEALAQLKRALDPRHPQPYVLDQIGRVYQQLQDFSGALDYYERALKIRRKSYILFNRAMTLLAMGKTGPAVRDLHEALKRDRLGKHKMYLELGKINLDQNKAVEARFYFESAIRFKQETYGADYAEAHYALVFYHLKSGDKAQARQELQTALEIAPNLHWDQNLRQILGMETSVEC